MRIRPGSVLIFRVTSIYAEWHIGIALSSNFVAAAAASVIVGIVCRCHTLYSGISQYLKNGLSDLIQIWHVDVTGTEGVLYSFVTLNSH